MAARRAGHEAWVIGVGDLVYDPDESIRARGRMVPKKSYKNGDAYVKDLNGKAAISRASHRHRPRHLDAAQRPSGGRQRAPLGCQHRHHVRPHCCGSRCGRAQRPERPREGHEQDVLPDVPGAGAATHHDYAQSGRHQSVRQGSGDGRAQATPGLRRSVRVPGAPRRRVEHEPDDRRRFSRRVRHRARSTCRAPKPETCGCS